MALFKRFEIWLLLVAILGGLAWVFLSGPRDEFEEEVLTGEKAAPAKVQESALVLRRLAIKRDYGNLRLDIDLKLRNDKPDKLILAAPKVRLVTNDGREVPSFFLPFDPVPELPANSTHEAQLRYWLEKKDLQGTLVLEVEGQKLLVKDGTPLDIEQFKNNEETVLKTVKW